MTAYLIAVGLILGAIATVAWFIGSWMFFRAVLGEA